MKILRKFCTLRTCVNWNFKSHAFQISDRGKMSEFRSGWIWNAVKIWRFWVKNLNSGAARSELFRNLTITHYFDISRWFHAINTVIDALSWINIDVYLTQCMHSIYCIMKIEVHCTVSDKSIWSVSLLRQLYLRILSTLSLN